MKESLINSHEALKVARLTAIDALDDVDQPIKSALSAYFEAITHLNKASQVEPYLSKFYRDKMNEARREARALLRIEQSRKNRKFADVERWVGRYVAMLHRG